MRLVLPLPGDVQLGASYARYRLFSSRQSERTLAGLDLFWSAKRFELSAEWLHSWGTLNFGSALPLPPGGIPSFPGSGAVVVGMPVLPSFDLSTSTGYVQGVAPLAAKLYLVGRVDWQRFGALGLTGRQSLIGLTWRPSGAVAVKAEWVFANRRAVGIAQGMYSSVSVLF
jgi:hypothetical protein